MNVYRLEDSTGLLDSSDGIGRYYGTLAKASRIKNILQSNSSNYYNNIIIKKVSLDTSKSSILAMLNYEGGFELSADEVA